MKQATAKIYKQFPSALLDIIIEKSKTSQSRFQLQELKQLIDGFDIDVTEEELRDIGKLSNSISILSTNPSMWSKFTKQFHEMGLEERKIITIITQLTEISAECIHKELNPKEKEIKNQSSVSQSLKTNSLFEFSDGTITKYLGNNRHVKIPSSIGREPVLMIGKHVFADKNLLSVTLPEGLMSIGESAFQNNKISQLSIPDSVLEIENTAFGNNKISTLQLPSQITRISPGCFAYNKLVHLVLPEVIESIERAAFSHNQLESVVLPKSLKKIGLGAFLENKIRIINFPEKLNVIEAKAFQNNQLHYTNFPLGITKIGKYSFKNNRLEKVSLPSRFLNKEINAFDKTVTITYRGSTPRIKPKIKSQSTVKKTEKTKPTQQAEEPSTGCRRPLIKTLIFIIILAIEILIMVGFLSAVGGEAGAFLFLIALFNIPVVFIIRDWEKIRS